jgi:hypothetical protein
MGQFKPKVKMETTEPSVTLKLKKGGNVKKMNPGGLAAMPMGQQRVMPPALMRRKEGGSADMAQDKKLVKKAVAQHDMQSHKGDKATKLKLKAGGDAGCYKTGGVANSNAGGYKTGGVANSNAGGYKNGGLPKSGIIKSNKGKQTMSDGEFMPTIRGHKGVAEGYKAGGKMCKF